MKFSISEMLKNFGPAWLVMIADVDIASIVTGLQAGSEWGYRMIFIFILLIIPLFFIQDAAGRLGIASGLGLGEATRKYFGRKVAVAAALPMAIGDFLEYVAEYAGIGLGLYLLGLPVLPGLVIAYLVHTLIVVGRQYAKAEAILLPLSLLLVAGFVLTLFVFPFNAGEVFSIGLSPFQPYGNSSYDYLMAASIGAVIMPWMLYFQSGANARRLKRPEAMKAERIETLLGAAVSEVLMVITVLVGLNLASSGGLGLSDLPKALSVFGANASLLMGIGFISAGFLALVVISMGSAWGVLEALNTRSRRAFLIIYSLESLPAVVLVMISSNYVTLMLSLMVIFTIIVLPSLYLLGKLVSRPDVMNGYQYDRRWQTMFWIMAVFIAIGGLLGILSQL